MTVEAVRERNKGERGGVAWDGGWVKTGKGLRSTFWQLQNSHGDVNYSTGNIVSNGVITVHGVRWGLD